MYYDPNEIPACPAVRIRISDAVEGTIFGPFAALVDTGADVSCIPLSVTAGMPNLLYEKVRMEFPGGAGQRVDSVIIPQAVVEFLDDQGNILLTGRYDNLSLLILQDGLLGRDILNSHFCEFDGPSLRCTIR